MKTPNPNRSFMERFSTMTQSKFKPVTPSKETKRTVIPLHISIELANQLNTTAQKANISRAELMRQMIQHCLINMND